jgi:hypothetical protein
LNFNCKLPGTTAANDLAESIDRGDLDGVSFGFICKDDKWAAADDGDVIRTVLAAELMEISPCSFAAYPANSVSVRSCPAEFRSKLKRNDQCQCACPECVAGNCAECSDPDCDDENCRCERSAKRGIEARSKDTKRVDDEDLTKDCFAYRPDDNHENWKLPIKFASEEKTKTHIRNAIARFADTDMPDAEEKPLAWQRIVAAAKKYGIEVNPDDHRSTDNEMALLIAHRLMSW